MKKESIKYWSKELAKSIEIFKNRISEVEEDLTEWVCDEYDDSEVYPASRPKIKNNINPALSLCPPKVSFTLQNDETAVTIELNLNNGKVIEYEGEEVKVLNSFITYVNLYEVLHVYLVPINILLQNDTTELGDLGKTIDLHNYLKLSLDEKIEWYTEYRNALEASIEKCKRSLETWDFGNIYEMASQGFKHVVELKKQEEVRKNNLEDLYAGL